ncbi:MAG: aminoglycoside phosphotransferase family protein [Ardenticatenales bacterium]|nr:aminoglycoside phosphotransferase family protein [Ardenticatenales bacterium]
MSRRYLGVLPHNDPMYTFLAHEVLGQVLGIHSPFARFDVHRLDRLAVAFEYRERQSGVALLGKFYGNKPLPFGKQVGSDHQAVQMQQEFAALHYLRTLGLDHTPCRVVRPLAQSEALNCLLVEEFVAGEDLLFFIRAAIEEGRSESLRTRLTELARLLAMLHDRTERWAPIDTAPVLAYLDKLIVQLTYWHILSLEQQQRLLALRAAWGKSLLLHGSRQVLIHGDATPANFIFQEGQGVIAIDLERLRLGDRAADLGCIAAELKHLFLWYGHDEGASEPYIQHLYQSYVNYMAAQDESLTSLTARGRFYMGCIELRISRNAWLDWPYRRRLIDHAMGCLAI